MLEKEELIDMELPRTNVCPRCKCNALRAYVIAEYVVPLDENGGYDLTDGGYQGSDIEDIYCSHCKSHFKETASAEGKS